MTDDELTARLAWSRKQMMQRKNRPLAKHADETLAKREAYEDDVFAKMLERQEPMPPEFSKVLEDNAWSLYER